MNNVLDKAAYFTLFDHTRKENPIFGVNLGHLVYKTPQSLFRAYHAPITCDISIEDFYQHKTIDVQCYLAHMKDPDAIKKALEKAVLETMGLAENPIDISDFIDYAMRGVGLLNPTDFNSYESIGVSLKGPDILELLANT